MFFIFIFSVGKKNLFVAERCHMAEGCQTNTEYFAGSTSNMADAWREDLKLREHMERYVRQGYKREEALEFLKRDFPMYPWSIRSLDRRLRCFEIYNNPEVSVEEVKDAVKKELKVLGDFLGIELCTRQ